MKEQEEQTDLMAPTPISEPFSRRVICSIYNTWETLCRGEEKELITVSITDMKPFKFI